MNNNLSKLFKQAYDHPKTGLSDDIWRVIENKQERRLKIQSFVYGFLSLSSVVGFVFIFISTKNQFISSGFSQYVSLAFSDGNILASYWKEYLMSLADSIPVASLGALSFLLFSALISIRKTVSCYKNQLLKV